MDIRGNVTPTSSPQIQSGEFGCHNVSNLSCCNDSPYPIYQVVLRLYVIGPLALFGLITNILNIYVFSRSEMRSSLTNWFLLMLGMSDSVLLLTTLSMLSYPVLAELLDHLFLIDMATHLTRWAYPLACLSQTFSVYLVVMVSAHRYFGICRPFVAQRHGTKENVKLAIALTFVFSCLFTGSRWLTLITKPCYSLTFQRPSIIIGVSHFATEWLYHIMYNVIGYILVMFLFPFVTLCVVNFSLVQTVRKSNVMRQKFAATSMSPSPSMSLLTSPTNKIGSTVSLRHYGSHASLNHTTNNDTELNSKAHSDSLNHQNNLLSPHHIVPKSRRKSKTADQRKEQSVTVMLVTMVILFLLCNSLPFLNNILEILLLLNQQLIDRSYYTISVEIGNLLVNVNASCYLLIYLSFNTKYRHLLVSKIPYLNRYSGPEKAMSNTTLFNLNYRSNHSPSPSPRPSGLLSPQGHGRHCSVSIPNNTDPPSCTLTVSRPGLGLGMRKSLSQPSDQLSGTLTSPPLILVNHHHDSLVKNHDRQ